MQAVILAAGKSTRTYPLTLTRPKVLLTVANKTLLEHNLEQLLGIADDVIIVVGYKKEMITKRFGNSFGRLKIKYVEQTEQLGTGHAVMLAKDLIDGRFIVLNGDDFYSREDIKRCLRHHYCVLGQKVKDPENWGIFALKEENKIEQIVERPKEFISNLANTGLYVLDKKIFDFELEKTERDEYEIVDYVTELAKNHGVHCETVHDYWFPVRYPWDLLGANKFFLSKIKKSVKKGKIERGARMHGNVVIGKGTIIKSGTYIEGPVVIGENCIIGPNAYIRPDTTIGNNCRIRSEVYDCIIMHNVTSKHHSYLGHSVIGENCNIAAGTITADYRHDGKSNITIVKEEKVDSGRRKLGAFIGDNVNTGINTSIYPGRKIWAGKTTLPGEIVKKDIID